ncbi:MAG: xanthine dehydrogenase family protein subunit M [Desulfobacteraceae bacterium]|nr:xanthine dehydrogenase family protein subunit M [Desulfobacteraceae bacterium]
MRNVFQPESLPELWRVFEAHPGASVCAGGTDLLVKMRSAMMNPESIACVDRIPDLRGITTEEGGMLRIGACATHGQIVSDPAVRRMFPILVRAVENLGSPPIRNMGTIGGNICTASPAGDTLPPLYALGAEIELRCKAAQRRMLLKDFISGPGKTCLRQGEILASVRLKPPEGYYNNIQHFEKVGQRNALACSIASLAALLQVASDGVVLKAALAWGSVAPVVMTCPDAEKELIGKPLTSETLRRAAAAARQCANPISDVRADRDYRLEVLGNLLMRLLEVAPESAPARDY